MRLFSNYSSQFKYMEKHSNSLSTVENKYNLYNVYVLITKMLAWRLSAAIETDDLIGPEQNGF